MHITRKIFQIWMQIANFAGHPATQLFIAVQQFLYHLVRVTFYTISWKLMKDWNDCNAMKWMEFSLSLKQLSWWNCEQAKIPSLSFVSIILLYGVTTIINSI
jgi:type IV secretory pathway VirB3-like protein